MFWLIKIDYWIRLKVAKRAIYQFIINLKTSGNSKLFFVEWKTLLQIPLSSMEKDFARRRYQYTNGYNYNTVNGETLRFF